MVMKVVMVSGETGKIFASVGKAHMNEMLAPVAVPDLSPEPV